MVIALNEVVDEPFVSRAIILAVVAIGITILVYGVVGAIVKMDDAGLALSQREGKGTATFGRGLVKAMPRLLTVLSVVGTAAMLWVGGHIILLGTDELGLHLFYDVVHHLEEAAHEATGALGGVVGWLVNTLGSALLGLVVGAIIVTIGHFTWHRRKAEHAEAEH
jgi:predicted DNA repair protein MutK